MNYIRGAVSAISAPYQYYKDLPPINPSTLTGAIDVIVIRRPTDNGESELVCSPFHVRFGKWQVLRPSEKKVNVFVNGNPIPFNMKIGEAGEAFFVFETDDDVPEDLITSPILQPTMPDETPTGNASNQDPVDTDRFAAKQDEESQNLQAPSDSVESELGSTRVEPDFLDLDGRTQEEDTSPDDVRTTPKQKHNLPSALRKSGSRATINQSSVTSLPSPPPSPGYEIERSRTPAMEAQDARVDVALKRLNSEVHVPEVEYHHDVTLDMEGYKSGYHDRIASDKTVRSSGSLSPSKPNSKEQVAFPRKTDSSTPSLPSDTPYLVLPHTQSSIQSSSVSSPSPSPSPTSAGSRSPIASAQPFFRATSEPPPDIESENEPVTSFSLSPQTQAGEHQMPVQEYSWEWGAFPQPSPRKASFGKGGRIELPHWRSAVRSKSGFNDKKGGSIFLELPPMASRFGNGIPEDGMDEIILRIPGGNGSTGRSRSVPPRYLDNSAKNERKGSREYKEYEDANSPGEENEERGRSARFWEKQVVGSSEPEEDSNTNGVYGVGGTLSPSKNDPTMFVLSIEGRKIGFQLSLVPLGEISESSKDTSKTKQRFQDEFEVARQFDRFRVDWPRFIEDESIVSDPRLVIRWAGNHQYITRSDGSPLMDSLIIWRSSVIRKRESGDSLRPVSPPPPPAETSVVSEDELSYEPSEQKSHGRAKSESPSAADIRQQDEKAEPASQGQGSAPKPTSSSWVQWWNRSRRKDASDAKGYSNVLNPKNDTSTSSLPLPASNTFLKDNRKSISEDVVTKSSAASAFMQQTPDGGLRPSHAKSPSDAASVHSSSPPNPPIPSKRFAKTLRLTSDQLKSLNLRSGPNSITFSLSASGAIAATARIFVWDSTDLVVISDIDGTITKSDGLGHVFAMIGRDWTHLGVAKLYTDITRNGYKIMYLTSRAIGQADATRDYLKGIKQNNYQLPEGPVIMSPDRLMASLHREVIMRKPELFKMACLRDIQRLFGESARNPFYAGFGNRITDALSYRSVNVPSARIFTIDSSGEVKMELLELAGYKSSYIHMTDLVDQMFPPIHRKWTPEYTDFNYWKTPVQDFPLPDMSPPSPALSARSDTSNQSALARLRNFSLGANNNPRPYATDSQPLSSGDGYRSSHLRQMSSFEKLSSTLGFMTRVNGDPYRRSASPESSSSYIESDDEDDEGELGVDGQRRKRNRRRSMTSMPGTLDESHFGMDEDDGEEGEQHVGHEDDDDEGAYEGEENPEEEAEEAFDDDLLAAGEMQNVPFL
ncbi:Nuclear elongation and deformation protein 1 [Psilocybe cubensis]|uniref:phosphatidate phosphatase n=2 Tax=Psilocybe cubensis TaxID=181762 RepID=A0A8H7Y0U6_PSICU|nr:Nuclear elongation and deformation protein 1 [Psilocybe cubensis]KAH9482509.1 Nuclear elongation and deformation protein 1 [Psilocybe cubensis]